MFHEHQNTFAIESMESRCMMSATASVPDAPERTRILPYIEQGNVYKLSSTPTLKVGTVGTTSLMEEEGIYYF